MTAVVAGAMTAGVASAGVVAVPEKADPADVELAVTIFDIDWTIGPLRIIRELAITGGLNPLEATLTQEGGNTYNLPGLNTLYDSTSTQHVEANRIPGESIEFSWDSDQGESGGWNVLGVAGGGYVVDNHRDLSFTPLLGGSRGIGAALDGTLSEANYDRNVSFFGSNLDLAGSRTLADFDGELALTPFDGFKAVGGGTLIDTTPAATFNLGSLTGSAGGHGGISGDGGLCLGSAQASCDGRISYLTVGAPVSGDVKIGSREILSANFETNEVAIELRPGQFSVTGAVGGTFSIGSLDIGRPIPIDFHFPHNSAVTSLSNERRTETVRNSLMAVPRKSGSDNETGSTGRHAAGDAVNNAVADVKTAVNKALNSKPRHAKPASKD